MRLVPHACTSSAPKEETPTSVTQTGTQTNSATGQNRPNQVGDFHVADAGAAQWFNPAAFAAQPANTWGSEGRNLLTAPVPSVALGRRQCYILNVATWVAAMNVAVTTAAEGFPRRAFTVEDIGRMMEAGVIRDDERFELVEGEIVMMAAKGIAHERIKSALTVAISRALPDDLTIAVEATLRLSDTIML